MILPHEHAASEAQAAPSKAAALGVTTLSRRADFLKVQGSTARFSRPAFLLTCHPLPPHASHAKEPHCFVGYTATKKLGNAVVRNRIKRRLRAAAVPMLAELGRAGLAYVWIAREASEGMNFAEMEKDMRWAIARVHAMPFGTQPRPPRGKKKKKPKAAHAPA